MLYYFVILFCIIFDQLTKIIIKSNYHLGEEVPILSPYINWYYTTNDGIAFGFPIENQSFLLIFSFIAVGFVIKYFSESLSNSSLRLSLSLILGGAFGNLIDRVLTYFNLFHYSGVIDFISIINPLNIMFNFGPSRWYIFNLADLFISFGLIIYIASFFRQSIRHGR